MDWKDLQNNVIGIVIIFLLLNVVLYLCGYWITWESNIMKWGIITESFGRFVVLFIEGTMVIFSIGLYVEYNKNR